MKQQLFNILPNWLKSLKYSDKIAHAIYGTLSYLLLTLFLDKELSFALVFFLAVLVEFYDLYTDKATSDAYDVFATITIPLILMLL